MHAPYGMAKDGHVFTIPGCNTASAGIYLALALIQGLNCTHKRCEIT